MTTYSAFFSSGLLASRHAADSPYDYDPSSPLSDSDLEPDTDRENTPTPENITRATPAPAVSQRRHRKRRSSLTIATSPMNAIRSPQRNATAALQLQKHLPSPSRSRSGSLSATGANNIASQGTSLVGRMRSGSIGAALRPRRNIRRLVSVPAAAPPPTVPLPALPALFPQTWFNPSHTSFAGAFQKSPFLTQDSVDSRAPLAVRAASDQSTIKGRQRGFSLSDGLTIDEEMKEN
ncbi:hypothetical protein C0992_010416 [Termitomyces sp. T32_za158]|nr:hypothetical protein C0992_010416 [Termitomyces sp. T32_za158]